MATTTTATTASTVYISTSANRYSQCSSTAPDGSGLVVFGAGRGIALWNSTDPTQTLVHRILPGHEAEVVSVAFLPSKTHLAFASGDASGRVIFWRRTEGGAWEKRHSTTDGHSASVTSIASLAQMGWLEGGEALTNQILVFTCGSDCKVQVWLVSDDASETPKILQTIQTSKIPLALSAALFPRTSIPLLALALTDRKVQIYTYSLASSQFTYTLSLEGHIDWVRTLDFSPASPSSDELLLASGSQDGFIRLWSITPAERQQQKQKGADEWVEAAPVEEPEEDAGELDDKMLEDFERKLGGGADGEDMGGEVGQVSMKAFFLNIKDRSGSITKFSLSLSSVLTGHDTWVTSVHFSPLPHPDSSRPLQLLSSSADNSLILWSPTAAGLSSAPKNHQTLSSQGIFFALQRFGQISMKGLGFFGALWGREGREVLASGWAGGWNVWTQAREGGEDAKWEERSGPTGHFEQVKAAAWGGREGREWLLSVSSDETSRIHAPWTRSVPSSSSSSSLTTWAEISRPQIHGYPFTSAATLPPSQRFVSGADEKVVRVFEETEGFVASLDGFGAALGTAEERAKEPRRAVGASVPPLGLSNKSLLTDDPNEQDDSGDSGFNYTHFSVSGTLTEPPTENTLSSSTLWPELEKLYGHGYELMAVASSNASHLIATSCKATTPQHAVVRLYSTNDWRPFERTLAGHSLTVTRIAFSQDDELIVTVGRDRGWCLFAKDKDGRDYHPLASLPKAHARIIWDVSFSPLLPISSSFFPSIFATASRDKTVKIWRSSSDSGKWEVAQTLKFDEGVTSCDFYRGIVDDRLILAVGLESGPIHIHNCPVSDVSSWTRLLSLDSSVAHLEAVTRLAFQPPPPDAPATMRLLRLASASDDRSTRVFELQVPPPSA